MMSASKIVVAPICGFFALVYVVAFLPLAPYLIPLGLLATACEQMTLIGAALGVMGTALASCSMPCSSYLICRKLARQQYGQALLCCLLPPVCFLGALLWLDTIALFHIYLLASI